MLKIILKPIVRQYICAPKYWINIKYIREVELKGLRLNSLQT